MTRWLKRTAVFLCVYILGVTATLSSAEEIDLHKAKELHQRFLRGEKLTEKERAQHERAVRALRAKAKARAEQLASQKTKHPVALKPLTDMTASDHYKGQDGGLYGGGKNQPPEDHFKAAMHEAKLVQPVDAVGMSTSNGKIGFVSFGMSNTSQEFSVFARLANADSAKSPKVVIVDGAQGGTDARSQVETGKENKSEAGNSWDGLDERLKKAGLSNSQVQVAWVNEPRSTPSTNEKSPKHAQETKATMIPILNKLKEKFPNLHIAYLSSRIYAGYAKTPANSEPSAYESAFGVRSLIQEQIKGDRKLNYDSDKGLVKSPLLLWGPYLWADGEKGRKAGDLVWKPEDFERDGTHPSPSGRKKVAELLLHFMKTDPTAKMWFTARSRKDRP